MNAIADKVVEMKRLEFIMLLGGAAAWPLVARAQQSERVRRIGALMSVAADHPEAPARVGAFSQGLAELGWTIGRNARIDIRWGTAALSAFANTRRSWLHSRPTSS
jgi:putative ABC transport system substrate-binding protein